MTFDALFLRFLIFGLLLAVFTFTEVKLAFGRNPSHNAHGYSQNKHHNQSSINTTVPSIVPPLGERELCFREQPRTCTFDYSFRPAPLVLMQPRSRDDKTGSWNSVPLPYKAPRRKVNILYLSPNHKFYLHGMDRQFYDEMDAAIGHPDVEVFHFGVKFPGWNETWSLAENLNSKFPGIQFDIVYSKDFYQEYDSPLINPVVTHTFGKIEFEIDDL
ncbi:hypothetical protein HDU79_002691 [Rhizoclosmatium sp. JEL0117]|nr:hypothetical protein HDU79_002691 [Rhizoclosmatium sp. JEL0117]